MKQELAVNTTLLHYRIVAKIGAGGMGEVYLAEDTRLRRKVALKLLPEDCTREVERVLRFEQEARAASALNHPNILTIHEIGQAEGMHYLATEFVDGQTLRERLSREKVPPRLALDCAVQMAAALAAAHAAGIVHRDIKPENVMLRHDGIVKVLDFGLAKLLEQKHSPVDSEAATLAKVNTNPGTVLGTASYMSPEQARGQEVDARTDIFSLGVVLYEMLVGCAPFQGINALDVISDILKTEPPPLKAHVSDLPAELQRIINKTLRKNRDERYQHSKDLWLDLNDLLRELEFEEKLKARQLPATESGEQARTESTTAAPLTQATASTTVQPTTSSAKIILSELKRHKTGALLGLAAIVLLLGSAALGVYKLLGSSATKSPPSTQALKFTRLTAHGQAVAAAISPDGKYVVYAKQEPAGQSVWLRQVEIANSDVQIIPPQDTVYRSFTYSPDGNYIYYLEGQPAGPGTLSRMSALGRNATKLLSGNVSEEITISPDGQRIAFIRGYAAKLNELMVASAEGKELRVLATGEVKRDLYRTAAWSPDHKSIACGLILTGEGELSQTLVLVNVENGARQQLTAQRWGRITHLQWLPDGSGILLLASDPTDMYAFAGGANLQLWLLSLPDGAVRRLTNDLNSYASLSVTADRKRVVTLQQDPLLNIWVAPKGDANRARPLPRLGKADGVGGLSWTPDGRLVFTSLQSSGRGLWLTDVTGTQQKQLNVGDGMWPEVSGDGRWLVFASLRAGNFTFWRADLNGNEPKPFSNHVSYRNGSLTPDGQWLIYGNSHQDTVTLWKVPLAGGTPVQLTEQHSFSPAVSPDGQFIAYFEVDEKRRRIIGVMPLAGGPAIKTFVLSSDAQVMGGLRWSSDGRLITYISTRNGVSNIWGQPFAGGEPQPLTDFKTEQIRAFAWSRDGQLAVSRGLVTSDVVLISEIK